jgi:hypothetical protein
MLRVFASPKSKDRTLAHQSCRKLLETDPIRFATKLAELEVLYGRQGSGNGEGKAPLLVNLLCRGFECCKVESIPASIFERFSHLRHRCGAMLSLKDQVREQEPNADGQQDAEVSGEMKSQRDGPAERRRDPEMMTVPCPGCGAKLTMERQTYQIGGAYVCGCRTVIRW